MCKYCDLELYYGECGKDSRYQVADFLICPFCGEIKKDMAQQYGGTDEVLRLIVETNTRNMNEHVKAKFIESLKVETPSFRRVFLKENSLEIIEPNMLKCSCGGFILHGNTAQIKLKDCNIKTIVDTLRRYDIMYCAKCGRKLIEHTEHEVRSSLIKMPMGILVSSKEDK